MVTNAKKAILTAGIAAMSFLPLKGTAQPVPADSEKSKNQTELKFGYDKKEFKKALKATKFFDYNESYNATKDNSALIEYLASDTAMLAALTEELLLVNEQILNKDLQIGDTTWFVSKNPDLIKIPGIKLDPYSLGITDFFEAVVDKNNKSIIVQEKKDDLLNFYGAKIRREFYHSAILNQKVYGEQILAIIVYARQKLSQKLDNFYTMQKQQEIIKKHGLQNRKTK